MQLFKIITARYNFDVSKYVASDEIVLSTNHLVSVTKLEGSWLETTNGPLQLYLIITTAHKYSDAIRGSGSYLDNLFENAKVWHENDSVGVWHIGSDLAWIALIEQLKQAKDSELINYITFKRNDSSGKRI